MHRFRWDHNETRRDTRRVPSANSGFPERNPKRTLISDLPASPGKPDSEFCRKKQHADLQAGRTASGVLNPLCHSAARALLEVVCSSMIADQLVRFRNWLLLTAVVLLGAALPIAGGLTFDQTIESFFPADHPDILLLQQTRQDFGGDEFVIIAWKQPGLLEQSDEDAPLSVSAEATAEIGRLVEQLNQLPGVDSDRTQDLPGLLNRAPRSRNTRTALLQLFQGVLIGADQETTAIVLQLLPASKSSVSRETAIRGIREAVQRIRPDAAIAGEAVQIQEMFDLVERDGNLLYAFSLIVLSAILLWVFRGLRWVISSLLIVVGSVAWTRASLVLVGAQLSMVSSMLNSLVTIISISTTTHILVHYRELRRGEQLDAEAAAIRTMRELSAPVFWTLVTVAVGFAALLVSEITPVRSFSVMMTLGTMLIPVFILLVMPATLVSGRRVAVPGQVKLEDQLDRILDGMANLIDRFPIRTSVICLLLTAMTAPGLFVMQVETDFSRNFRESSPVLRSLRFVEAELGPAGTWDISFDVPNPLTSEFLSQIDSLVERVRELQDDGIPLEVVSLTDALNVPPRIGTSIRRLGMLRGRQPQLAASFLNQQEGRMRILLRSPEQQPTEEKLLQVERVRGVVSTCFEEMEQGALQSDGQRWKASATASGLFVVMARIIDSLLADQLRSFLLASLGTVICTAFAFRSLRLGLISLVPNVFPIGIVTGSLGLLNVPVNIGTAMIASVAMGFTCGVHYIAEFERALPECGLSGALRKAQAGVGRAVVLAHLALVAGFLVLTVSEFIPLVYFGGLLSLSMAGGLVSDLVMLPLLLRWTTPVPSVPGPMAADTDGQ